jgi:hypothetical protein
MKLKPARIVRLLLTILGTALITGCSSTGGGRSGHPGQVEHVVLIWLKKPGDAATRAKIIETARGFKGQIPGILSVSAGETLPSKRPVVVDSSFDVGVVIRFASSAALDAYETNPIHQQAAKDVLKPVVRKLLVYDISVR